MTDPTLALMEYLRSLGEAPDDRVLQEGLQRPTQTVMEMEAAKRLSLGIASARRSAGATAIATGSGSGRPVWGVSPQRVRKVRAGT